eukprot:scaffold77242_cov19-Prasinocladus_malaysianus.AAC.1
MKTLKAPTDANKKIILPKGHSSFGHRLGCPSLKKKDDSNICQAINKAALLLRLSVVAVAACNADQKNEWRQYQSDTRAAALAWTEQAIAKHGAK